MEELGQVFISPDMVPAVRIMLDCIPAWFRPVEWRATPDAMAAWENQSLIVTGISENRSAPEVDDTRTPLERAKACHGEMFPVPGSVIFVTRRSLTIGGIPAKLDDSLPTHSLCLYGEREAA